MDDQAASALMARFGKAFFRKDRALLAEVITPAAQWHFAFGADAPDGRVRVGIDGFLQGANENEALFERLRFEDVVCRALGDDRVVMTYLLDGKHRNGAEFRLRGIELITVEGDRIAIKDVFWKQYWP